MGRRRLPFRALLPWFAGIVLVASSAVTARGEMLRVGGTGAAMATMQALGDAFIAHHRGEALAVEILPTVGSTGGIRAVGDGVITMAASLRPLRPPETARGLVAVSYGRTPFVFVTTNRQATGVTTPEILAIYRAEKRFWDDGTPLRPILRPKADTATQALEMLIPEVGTALDALRRRGDLPVATTEQDNLDFAQRVDGSFASSTLAQVVAEHADLRLLTFDGKAPTLINLEEALYPLVETFHLVFPADAKLPLRFLAFIRSPAGERILRQHGTLPMRRAQ